MKNAETVAGVHTHTHTHTDNLNNKINIIINKDSNIKLVSKIDTG